MNKEEILLGIDYGERNVGIAFGRNGFVSPIKTISGKYSEALNEISKIAIFNKITKIIIGLPTDYRGKETLQSKKTRHFVKFLRIRLKIPTQFVDEYGTSEESLEESIDFGISQKKRKVIDDLSAAAILKHYYKQQPAQTQKKE
jgi:putative transcription antitermination factor YqgF